MEASSIFETPVKLYKMTIRSNNIEDSHIHPARLFILTQ
jgi:hypothetical protein